MFSSNDYCFLLKVDVEGFEPTVLASARSALADGRIENLVMEFFPKRFGSIEQSMKMLERFFDLNLTVSVLTHSQGAIDGWLGRQNLSSFDLMPERQVLTRTTALSWVQAMMEKGNGGGKDLWIYKWPKLL